jgi:hypothetical protein
VVLEDMDYALLRTILLYIYTDVIDASSPQFTFDMFCLVRTVAISFDWWQWRCEVGMWEECRRISGRWLT